MTLGINTNPSLKFSCSYKNYLMFTASFPLHTPCSHIMEQQTTNLQEKLEWKTWKVSQEGEKTKITGYNSVRPGKKTTEKLQGARIREDCPAEICSDCNRCSWAFYSSKVNKQNTSRVLSDQGLDIVQILRLCLECGRGGGWPCPETVFPLLALLAWHSLNKLLPSLYSGHKSWTHPCFSVDPKSALGWMESMVMYKTLHTASTLPADLKTWQEINLRT